MRVTIIFDDKCIGVDGKFHFFEESEWDFEEDYHAIQWYDTYGHIELRTTEPNIEIKDFSTILHFVNKWNEKNEKVKIQEELEKKQAEHWLKLERIREMENKLELERLEARLKEIESQLE